jgi:hypothetical protein
MNSDANATPNSAPNAAEPPLNPPSIVALADADRAAAQGRTIRLPESASDLGLIHMNNAAVRRMMQAGVEAETLGVSKIYNGALVMSASAANEAAKIIASKMQDTEDIEALCALAHAQAALTKAVATAVKSAGGVNAAPEKQVRGRRSFAKGAQIGPAIDIKAA